MISQEDFWKAIDNARGDLFVTSTTVDWGGMPRGAGKRSGRMVMGAMSGAVRGKKTYSSILGSAPLEPDDRAEADALEPVQQILIARALTAGHPARVAMLVAYTIGPDPITRKEAFDLAVKKD